MGRLILVTGGCRSGKSAYALNRAEAFGSRRAFVATCPPLDEEMAGRIERHRSEREARDWRTEEEPIEIAATIARLSDFDVVLIDCLTLWVNNIFHEADRKGETPSEDDVRRAAEDLANAARMFTGTIVAVTNEIGMGVVPDNPAARLFRDCLGRCNQVMAGAADEVTLVVSGIPLTLKQVDHDAAP